MKIISTRFHGLKKIKGINYSDKRGYFREIFKNNFFKNKKLIFYCISKSRKNVIRGLHLQKKFQQDKLVSVIKGKIFDVVVDLRKRLLEENAKEDDYEENVVRTIIQSRQKFYRDEM